MNGAREVFRDNVVLITGGTGSFGKCCVRALIEDNLAAKVIVFSRDEWKQWEMRESDPLYSHPKLRYFLGDVRDKERLRRALHEVNIVIHAAALKQVPVAEYNPSEFVKTNVLGAMNLIDAAIDAGVHKVVGLSTDKAVNPINLYGASKLCSDRLFLAANAYVGKSGFPQFSVVRYGNVLGSRGSLLPYWQELIDKGATHLPITDVRMTRFWITLPETVDFVASAIGRMRGGEIFIPKIPSVRIVALADAFRLGMPHTICGIRPGEKINEVLLSQGEARHAYDEHDAFIVTPLSEEPSPGKRVAEDFEYASNTNPLLIEDPRKIAQLLAKWAQSKEAACR